METPEAPDLNQAVLADTRALDRLTLSPLIAPPVSALAFEIFPLPAQAPPASLSAGYILPAPGGSRESSLRLTLQTFQQQAASTTVLQVPEVSPPVLPGIITGLEGFQGDVPLDPAAPSAGPAPPGTTSSRLPPITATPEPGEPSLPFANSSRSIPGTTVVPEPVAGTLLCAGLALLYIARRRRAL